MKKWGILVLVIAGGMLLALKYFSNKSLKEGAKSAVPGQEQQTGVALPPSATAYSYPVTAGPYSDGTGSYDYIALPEEITPYKGACEGGSLNEMRSTHGRYWGYFARYTPFSSTDTNKMYNLVAGYVGCVALAHDDISLCDSLPGEAEQGGIKVETEMSLRYKCRKLAGPLLLSGKKLTSHTKTLSGGSAKDGDPCAAPASGQKASEAARQECKKSLLGQRPSRDPSARPDKKDKSRNKDSAKKKGRPASESACGGDMKCVNKFRLFSAIKNGKVSDCPKTADRVLCEALITRSAKPCEVIIRDMSKHYCSAVERVNKATGGFLGMSPDEIKATFEQRKQERLETERQKVEGDKVQTEINKDIKKMFKKE